MPVYEYQCQDCGKNFDIVATIAEYSEGIRPTCPKCKSSKVQRIIGRATVLGTTRKGGDEDSFDESEGDEDLGDDADLGGDDLDDEQ